MANEKNLIPQAHKLTVEEQSKGGKASAKKRAAKKRQYETWRELGEMFLPMATKKGKLTNIKTLADLKGANITAEETIFFSLLNKAMRGDIAAINKLFELTGWNVAPSESEEQTQTAATDGFIKALEGKANDVWSDNDDSEQEKT